MPLTHARHWEVLWHHNFVKGIYIKRGAEMLHVFYIHYFGQSILTFVNTTDSI